MKVLKKFVLISIVGTLFGVFSALCILTYFSFTLPDVQKLVDYEPPVPSQIISRDGEILLESGKENRLIARIDEIPALVVNAFLSAEDDNFYYHSGVDYLGVFRAFLKNIKAGKIVQGGSTITQQVAKSILLSRERSYTRKIKDFLLALKIEKKLTKEQILELYLNQVYLGGGYYGIKAAFRGYFDKSLDEVSVSEAALIAGLLVAPGRYSPYVNPQYAKDRQLYVLRRMFSTEKISEEEYNAAKDHILIFRLRRSNKMKGGHFTDWVRQRVVELVGAEKFLTNGFRIHTTLDWELQKRAEKSIKNGLKIIDKRQGFKGPLKTIEMTEFPDFIEKQKILIFKENSHYFELFTDSTIRYEVVLEDEEVAKEELDEKKLAALKQSEEDLKVLKRYGLTLGNERDNKVLSFLKKDGIYKAVVLNVSNKQRLITLSIAGVVGIIDLEGYKWAHERDIVENNTYWSFVTYPKSILKIGDVVQVKIQKKSVHVFSHAEKDWLKKIKDKKHRSLIRKQKYLYLHLDQEPEVEGALISMNPKTGDVLTMVGGYDFERSQFNRGIQSLRQPGSSFKPFLYALGLENNYTAGSIILDSPEALAGVDESLSWKPKNYDNKFKGPITYRRSLQESRNVPTIKLAADLGVNRIFDFTRRIGLNAEIPKDLSIALGSFGVTLLELTSAYAIFPNGGKRIIPKSIISITDRNGVDYPIETLEPQSKTLEEARLAALETPTPDPDPATLTDETEPVKENEFLSGLTETQVFDSRLAYIMASLLKGVVQNPGGTGGRARSVSPFVGGKTGTTNNYVDAWFMGFSSNLVTGVWTGFDENRTMGFGEAGSRSALPIWIDFMRLGIKKTGESDFIAPKGIINVMIDPVSGKLPHSGSAKFTEVFVEGTEPGGVVTQENSTVQESSDLFEDDDYYSN